MKSQVVPDVPSQRTRSMVSGASCACAGGEKTDAVIAISSDTNSVGTLNRLKGTPIRQSYGIRSNTARPAAAVLEKGVHKSGHPCGQSR
jgi:hypothetical protein